VSEQAAEHMGSDDMLREILRKQEEALDLKGELVILNGKMDTLIETMDKKIKSQNPLAAIVDAAPQTPLYIFILILITLFLGFGPEFVGMLSGGTK
jgi:hypothetical protein